jgi:hypothetical protein
MERKLEKITMTKGGRTLTVEICEDLERYQGRRVYLPEPSTLYWTEEQLVTALQSCDKVDRVAIS